MAGDSPPIVLLLALALTAKPLATFVCAIMPSRIGANEVAFDRVVTASGENDGRIPESVQHQTANRAATATASVEEEAVKLFPVTPRISIRNTALLPAVIGFVFGLAPGWL